ncbi:MAG: hypothetical protein IKT68_07240 [Clostridia bacterium]|nr:hypothetical protein [Clostridia bacterium]
MKTRNKVLLLALVAILLVVTTVFATLAYLTSVTDTVTNTFTVGNVSITMDEADVNTDGSYKTDATQRDTENEYKLISGKQYIKDPTIHVGAGSEASYLFVKIDNQLGNNVTLEGGVLGTDLVLVDGYKDLYVYKLEAGDEDDVDEATMIDGNTDDIVLFETFTVANLNNDGLAALGGKEIVLKAFAIQNESVDFATAKAEAVTTLGATAA